MLTYDKLDAVLSITDFLMQLQITVSRYWLFIITALFLKHQLLFYHGT